MSPRARNLLFGALGLAIVVVTFAIVLPKIASYQHVWDVVRTLDTAWLVALAVAVVLNIVTFAPPWMIALPGLRFRQALPFTQASTAFTYIAPGGGIVGMAGSYGLLRAWGFGSNEVARAVTVTGIWNQLANLLLPVLAVMLLGIEGSRDAFLTTVAVIGGTVALDEATQHLPLQLFVAFSSLSAVAGNAGQAAYAGANAFLDEFARHREERVRRGERHGRTLSVNWPLWKDGGMAVSGAAAGAMLLQGGLRPMDPALGLDALAAIVRAVDRPVIAIGNVTPERVEDLLAAGVHGVAVASAVSSAADPASVVRALRRAVDAGKRIHV